MRVNDAAIGGVLLVLAIALGVYSQTFPAIPGQEYGAAVFPTVIAIALAGSSLVLIGSGLRSRAPLATWAEWAREPHSVRNVLITIAAVVFYILASHRLGFMLTAAPILLVLLRMLRVGWLASIAITIFATLLIQYVFGSLLYVPLPWGLLSPIRWW